MLIKLIRNEPQGLNIFGRLSVDNGAVVMDTLEHLEYAIPDGFYRLRMTYSPSFQQILPILDGVLGYARQPHNGIRRTGIRIHAGNTISHSRGCILVGDRDKNVKQQEESVKQPKQLNNNILRGQQHSPRSREDNAISPAVGVCCAPTEELLNCCLSCCKDNTPIVVNPRLLSSKKRLSELVNHLLNYQKLNPHEEIYIDISSPDPYPLADTACPPEAQQHAIDAREAIKRT